MSKKDEFKEFVSNHPELVNIVRDKKHTWQDLFEVYDLYGNDESLWNKYMNSSENSKSIGTPSLGELTKLVKNINIDNVQKYIETAQKAIGIVQELTKGTSETGALSSLGPTSPRPINKIFED